MLSPKRAILPRSIRLALAVVLASLSIGCRKAHSPQLQPVEGRVWLGGRPLQSGSISFYPIESGVEMQHLPMGTIDENGSYRIYYNHRPGCPTGFFCVVVFANESPAPGQSTHAGLPKSIIAACYNSPTRTPLRLEVITSPERDRYDLRLEP